MMVLAAIVLCLLVVTVGLGTASLVRWVRHASAPAGTVTTHIVLQLVAVGLWLAFLFTSSVLAAWAAFIVITAGQVFGDLLMFASYRARHPGAVRPGYRKVAADVLGFRRKAPALHATIGAVAYFGMLAACIWVSIR